MATRSMAHAMEEKAIFEAFRAAYPSFAAEIKEVRKSTSILEQKINRYGRFSRPARLIIY